MRNLLSILFFTLLTTGTFYAQNADDEVDPTVFNDTLLTELINDRLNEYRNSRNLDLLIDHIVVRSAAQDQAEANRGLQRINAQDDLGKRLEKYGGTSDAVALAGYLSTKKGKKPFTYAQLAQNFMDKFAKSKSNQKILAIADIYYSGIGAAIDVERKRVYVSLILGRVGVLNAGADKKKRKELLIPYSTKSRGISSFNQRACKSCDKFENTQKLHDGISLVGNSVYLTYDNLSELKRLLRKSDDGLAVDFVLREQYPCADDNITDNRLPSKGSMVKPIFASKLFAKNEVEGDRPRSFYGKIGKLKKKVVATLPDDYEYNVLILQSKTLCRTVTRAYLEEGDIESKTLFSLYPDTATSTALSKWEPKAEKNTLRFKVPFEQNKSNYDRSDIEPLLVALNEPEYVIDKIFIEAHSSLEGDSAKNAKLQRRRAESIIKVIEELSGTSELLKDEHISTSFGWDIFQEQIKNDNDYAEFRGKSFAELRELLKSKKTFSKLKPLLKDQRYAAVRMEITYDVSGENEEPYVISRLQKAVERGDGAEALKIQKFALKKIREGSYDASPYLNMEIPAESKMASVLLNQVYLKNQKTNEGVIDESLVPIFQELFEKAPENDYIAFNSYLMDVKFDSLQSLSQVTERQNAIHKLYGSGITPGMIDALNLEFQFKVLTYLKSIEEESLQEEADELIEACLEKIKAIYKIEGSSWQNALKLANIFIHYNDLKYALEILTPFTENKIENEDFFFTYIALAAHFEDQIFSRPFRLAMTKAKALNQGRFCGLFGAPKSTFQLLEHPLLKQEYCAACELN